jgi:CubicO group peptidase (beta-lactamase class C family)
MFCRLLEQGKLKLEDRVSDYLPEYAHLEIADGEGKRRDAVKPLLLEHLITMCGGLTYDIFHPLIAGAKDRTTRGIVKAIAGMPLVDEPGDTYLYSLCHDVLAAVMEQVTGTRYAELLKKEIIEPLGMSSTCFHPEDELKKRFAPQLEWQGRKKGAVPCGEDNKFCFSPDYDSGGAGLCSTLEDYILLPEALANGGLGRDGYPLLKPETIEAMRTDRIHGSRRIGFDLRWGRLHSYGYGLGVRTRIDGEDGGKSPVGEFGWDGAAGAYCLIDPQNHISAFYVQHVLNMGPVFEEIHPKLRDLIYQGLT